MSIPHREGSRSTFEIYPAYCNAASPTFNKWVKLTAVDLHGLRREPVYESQGIFFHLNHPIRFVYLAGAVAGIEWFKERWIIMTLDDGSGETVEVKIERVVPSKPTRTPLPGSHRAPDAGPLVREVAEDADDSDTSSNASADPQDPQSSNVLRLPIEKTAWAPKPLHPVTKVPGVRVVASCSDPSCQDHRHLELDSRSVRPGTLLIAKGSLSSYRGKNQLVLEHAIPILDADEEPRIWLDYAAFVSAVLCKPWMLSQAEVSALEDRARAEARLEEDERRADDENVAAHRRRRDARRADVTAREERKEAQRQAERTQLDGNPLDRADWRPWPEVEAQRVAEAQQVERRKAKRKREDDIRVEVLRKKVSLRVAGV